MISPEQIRRFSHFAGVNADSLRQVAMISDELEFEAGRPIFEEGQAADRLYVVVEGEVDVQCVLRDGTRRTVDTRVGGDLLCWSSIVAPRQTQLGAVARTYTRLISIDAPSLMEIMEADAVLGRAVMTAVAGEIGHRLTGARMQLAARD